MTDDLEIQLKKALEECAKLRTENISLRQKLGIQPVVVDTNSDDKQSAPAHNTLSIEQKISLFRSYFRGREDVYALRWEREGKKGYSPACAHDWDCPACSHDRKAKRSRCENRKFYTLADQTIHDHLSGKTTIGIYPLLTDETCLFLAADFDKANWLEDVRSFISSCKEHDIDYLLERSRSGKGGHVWIFFEHPIAASLARRLGSFLLTKAMEKRHQVGLDSYDRLFPNQDTMPKGGFGNLIALPLQREPRSHGNSIFIDENGNMHEDQWAVLAETKKINLNQIQEQIVNLPDSEERVILATGRYIGEGFDDSRLDTLFLVIPISWKGTLQQYVGRLHRSHDGKKLLQVYDYVDHQVPMLQRMFERRLTGYKTIGYSSQKEPPPYQALNLDRKAPELAYQMGQMT